MPELFMDELNLWWFALMDTIMLYLGILPTFVVPHNVTFRAIY